MASFLGIDLSKETFHAFLLSDHADAKKVFPNTPKGFEQLTTWLKNRHADEVRFCMEATGSYWEALASYLHGLDQHVSVVNPARIKAFAQSELLRTKTDAVDAALIARFCKSQSPEPWIPPLPEIRVLQALIRHCDHLKKTRAQQSVYAQSSDAAIVTASTREVIATLDEQIAQIERKIRQHFDGHPDLKQRRDLLTSIPGIGETTAGAILAEIPHLDRFESAKAVAAFAGLSPRERQSGTSIHGRPRMCKTGNARIRKALYMPAMVALRFNPTLRIFADRLSSAANTSGSSSVPSCVNCWSLPTGFSGQACLSTKIMLDAEYGIYPCVVVTASTGWRMTSPSDVNQRPNALNFETITSSVGSSRWYRDWALSIVKSDQRSHCLSRG